MFFIALFSWRRKENGEVQEKAPNRTLIFGIIHQAILEPQSSPSDSEAEAALERGIQRRSSQPWVGRAGNAESTQLSLVFSNASQEPDFWAGFFVVVFFFCSNFAPRPAVWAITINFWRGRAAIDCSKAIIGKSRTQTVFPTLCS